MLAPTTFGSRSWDPFADMRRLQAEMNRLFDDTGTLRTTRVYPPVNIWLGDNSVVVTAEMPGLSHDDIELTVHDDTLTIRGERPFAANDNEVAWHRRERASGTFARTVELPFRVDPDQVQARFQNGVLAVEMQRPEQERPRRIAVSTS
ncbi:Hsp20/alpha crystallin family protein [Oceaniradius stylonematis]|uniref:Hsp20/alpha crystallin family protein n=1 Tax=Oceaniradius stylonematis TaxID=2184161 RepID=UPI0035D0E02F